MADSRRLRTGRYSEPGRIYLVTSVVIDRQPVFADWRLGRRVVSQFRQAQEEGLASSIAWVVMPDHFHWLIELRAGELSDVVRRTKARTTHSVNAAMGRSGRLWQAGFHDRAVRREEDVKRLARYVIANPVRAGLVERVGDYPLWDAMWI
ncbi:transposase [Pseudomonas sp. R5(2019)]|uniref:REP-associated tyrosine transposase n=1 Tax=Pseudomonas sp. R5(2019) TaxID=2697566 RepID=UPI0014120952|nr:transposase [Pseudomonas sp. R5(2019)]NBA95906.1 transposase [Pseudomonas sp. R5(2019)]